MRNITIYTIMTSALAVFSAQAQLQTLVDNSIVITIPSGGYAVVDSADSHNTANLEITMQGVPFDYRLGDDSITGFTFTGPATIQFQGSVGSGSFATIDVASLRKAVGTNIQTLVVNPTNKTSATITVDSKSYAVIRTANTQSSATLSVAIQGAPFSYALQDVTVDGLTFAGPATIQLQGDDFGPSFVTVDTMPLKKSSKTQIQTLVVDPANPTSTTLSITGKNYAFIRSFDTESDATLSTLIGNQSVNFNDLQDESVVGFKFAGPASFQLQGDNFGPSFITIEVGQQHK